MNSENPHFVGLFRSKHGDKIRVQCSPSVFPESDWDYPANRLTGTASTIHTHEGLSIFEFELNPEDCAEILALL
jgi:hypothetical protein